MIKVQRIGAHTLPIPALQTPDSAGYDLRLADVSIDGQPAGMLAPGERASFDTGFAWEIPPGYVGLISACSGRPIRPGLDVVGGVIGADYRGRVKVAIINNGVNFAFFEHGEQIGQMVVAPVASLAIEEALSLSASAFVEAVTAVGDSFLPS